VFSSRHQIKLPPKSYPQWVRALDTMPWISKHPKHTCDKSGDFRLRVSRPIWVPMKIRCKLTGRRWSEKVLEHGEGSVTVTASYLEDASGGMARSPLAVMQDCFGTRFSFAEEPGNTGGC